MRYPWFFARAFYLEEKLELEGKLPALNTTTDTLMILSPLCQI